MDTNEPQHGQEGAVLSDAHRDHLRRSGLTDDTIAKAGIFSVLTQDAAAKLVNRNADTPKPGVPSLAFPYPGTDGYVRLRPDEPGTGPKYLAPTNIASRLYVPTSNLAERLAAGSTLWLVEGEKKCLVATQAGLVAVGAPGVWSFGNAEANRSAKATGEESLCLHPDLDKLPLGGRECVICFDSDIDTNPNVLRAAVRLGRMLKHAGAIAHISYIPSESDATKVGLDDYYAALPQSQRASPAPLATMVGAARPFDPTTCVEQYIAPRWRSWTVSVQEQELRRVVMLASELLGGAAFKSWNNSTARSLGLKVGEVRDLLPERETERHDALTWVPAWLNRHDVKYDMATELVRLAGEDVTTVHLFQRMALDADAFGGPRPQYLNYALDIWTDEQRKATIRKHREALRFLPSSDDVLARWVAAVTGKDDPVDRAVMAHFVWQVKRKLYGLPVEYHLMPLLHGAQGCGKTTAINKLTEPLRDLCDSPGDLQMLADSREAFRLNRAFIMFFDEMAKANRVDVDSLKNRITQDTLRWRALNMNRVAAGTNNATFIGATNTSLTDLIYDPSGVRRFYEIECQNPSDWLTVNGLDYMGLWRSIDENGAAPILPVLRVVKERQEKMRQKDAVEEFLAECCEVGGEWTSAMSVYESFKAFMAGDMRADRWSSSRFGRRVKALLGEDRVKVSNGTKYNLSLVLRGLAFEQVASAIEMMKTKSANEPMAAKKSA
jgi:hypothetical protein